MVEMENGLMILSNQGTQKEDWGSILTCLPLRKDGRFDDDPFNFDDLLIHGIEKRKDHNKTRGWRKGHNDHWNSRESRGPF